MVLSSGDYLPIYAYSSNKRSITSTTSYLSTNLTKPMLSTPIDR